MSLDHSSIYQSLLIRALKSEVGLAQKTADRDAFLRQLKRAQRQLKADGYDEVSNLYLTFSPDRHDTVWILHKRHYDAEA